MEGKLLHVKGMNKLKTTNRNAHLPKLIIYIENQSICFSGLFWDEAPLFFVISGIYGHLVEISTTCCKLSKNSHII